MLSGGGVNALCVMAKICISGVDWTVYTEDGKPSAQWEIMVLVTDDGAEILSY